MRIEPWVAMLAEELGCACHPSAKVAELIQVAVDDRRRRGKGRETWLTPYIEAWRQVYGGEPCAGVLARACDKVRKAPGASDGLALRSFCEYIQKTEAAYVAPMKWAQTWQSWLPRIPL